MRPLWAADELLCLGKLLCMEEWLCFGGPLCLRYSLASSCLRPVWVAGDLLCLGDSWCLGEELCVGEWLNLGDPLANSFLGMVPATDRTTLSRGVTAWSINFANGYRHLRPPLLKPLQTLMRTRCSAGHDTCST